MEGLFGIGGFDEHPGLGGTDYFELGLRSKIDFTASFHYVGGHGLGNHPADFSSSHASQNKTQSKLAGCLLEVPLYALVRSLFTHFYPILSVWYYPLFKGLDFQSVLIVHSLHTAPTL